jgi:site-specific DNA recombinase
MPNTNGHGPKRAILYTRVSTDEQARSGYSLAQQLEALRDYAAREGYEVLEEIADPGQSGASLERPGMDRVRELVAGGGVSVVLAQDLDRISREPWHYEYLRSVFEDYGTELRSLDDGADDSPMGEFMSYIRRGVAKLEKTEIAKRTRRGKLQKAKEGKVVATMKPPYGFSYNATRDGLVVNEREMAVVESIFRMAAEGLGPMKIQTRLYERGVPAPRGGKVWKRDTIKRLVMSDTYKPHAYKEVCALVLPAVAATLNPEQNYGIRWWNRHERKTSYVPGGGAGRSGKKTKYLPRDETEWIAVPIPASDLLPQALVERARELTAARRPYERKHLARPWELRGVMRCTCGRLMGTHTIRARKNKKSYHYYICKVRYDYRRGSCAQKHISAEKVEAAVWSFVSTLLKDPERLRAGMDALIDEELTNGRDPGRESRILHERIGECVRLRAAYQDQQAAGLMTLEELATKLKELEEAATLAQAELSGLSERQQRAEELARDRSALLEFCAESVPEALEDLSPEEKAHIYGLIRLEVVPDEDDFRASGVFCTSELSCW